MKSSKWILFFTCAVMLAAPSAFAETITIGAEDDWSPYSGKINGKAEGFTPDLVREAFKTQGIDVKLDPIPYARCMEDVKQSKLLACFNTTRTELLENVYLWHKDPMFEAEVAIYAKADSKESGLAPKDLEGKLVGLTNGYEYGEPVDKNDKIKKDMANTDLQNIKKTIAGRVQYTLVFTRVMKFLENNNPDIKGKLKPVGTAFKGNLYTVFAKNFKDSAKYVEAFNKGLAEIKKNGTYAKLEEKYK